MTYAIQFYAGDSFEAGVEYRDELGEPLPVDSATLKVNNYATVLLTKTLTVTDGVISMSLTTAETAALVSPNCFTLRVVSGGQAHTILSGTVRVVTPVVH